MSDILDAALGHGIFKGYIYVVSHCYRVHRALDRQSVVPRLIFWSEAVGTKSEVPWTDLDARVVSNDVLLHIVKAGCRRIRPSCEALERLIRWFQTFLYICLP